MKLILTAIFLFPLMALAQFPNTAFFKVRTKYLAFTTSAQTVFQGNCSGVITLQSRNSGGAASNVSSTTTISLSPVSGLSYFSDQYCRSSISSVSIASGQSSASFYFASSTLGTATITASGSGFEDSSQNETIATNPYVWRGLGGDSFWNTGANWSGGTAPGSTHIAVFNSTCVTNCSPTMSSNVAVRGMRIESGYGGTITQGSGSTLAIGSMGYLQYAGIFIGGNSDISISGSPFILEGGTFTSTQGSLKIVDSKGGYSSHDTFVVTNSNSFFHNTGLVWFHLVSNNNPIHHVKLVSGNPFHHVMLRHDNGLTDDAILTSASSATVPIVLGTLTLSGGGLRGAWQLQGNLVFGSNYGTYLGADSAAFQFVGSANQTIDNSANVAFPKGTVTINKVPSAKITLLSPVILSTGQAVTLTSGRFDLGGFNFTIPGSMTMTANGEVYLNGGVLRVGANPLGAGPYSSGTVFSGAAP